MRILQRGAALLLAAALWVPAAFAEETAPQSFVDVPAEHWAAADIAAVAGSGLMVGTGEGRFEPDREVTYAEFLTMLVRLTCPEKVDPSVQGAWYMPYLYAGFKLLGRTGLGEAMAQPDLLGRKLNRYDMAAMLFMAQDGVPLTGYRAIADWESIPDQYKDVAAAAWSMGLLRGVDEKGTFAGEATVTRAQAAAVLNRLRAYNAAQEALPPLPAGAVHITRANAAVEAQDTGDGFYIYSGEGIGYQGRIDFDNPGYTRLRFTLTTNPTQFESSHVFRVIDVGGAERDFLFYIFQGSARERTYEVDVSGVSKLDLSVCSSCWCEAVVKDIYLY